jgi:hypothetical protein
MRAHRWITALLVLGLTQACSCDDEEPGGGDGGDGGSVGGGDGNGGSDDRGGAGGDAMFIPDTGMALTDTGPGSMCVPTGARCDRTAATCCSGVCNDQSVCAPPLFCKGPGGTCTNPLECCSGMCTGGFCANQLCLAIGQACTGDSACCSGICNGTCQAVPPGPGGDTCKTLGETCTSTGACCSTNCQGGVCVRAFSCQANGDICRQNSECCGNVCSSTVGGTPGRCQNVSGGGAGGCTQDGNPCSGGSNCCTRICIDLGTGATVCQIASGCRLTGDYCSSDQTCCGGGTNPNGSVVCGGAPNGRCDNGQSCNPAGNICGARVLPDGGSVNASQNCCDGRQEVCKLDSAGIPRCFGGCTGGMCNQMCPTGYDPTNPSCCIPQGQQCQFRDQCCGRAPCVPSGSGDGTLVCAAPAACLPIGTQCAVNADAGVDSCCPGSDCRPTAMNGIFACQGSPLDGGAMEVDSGVLVDDAGRPLVDDAGRPIGADAAPPPDSGIAPCRANGTSCMAGAECCSGICNNMRCEAPNACQPQGATCTASGDCCQGLQCAIPGGMTSGTCQPGAVCSNVGQTCSPNQACCSGLTCNAIGTVNPCNGTTACTCNVNF